MGDQYYLKTPDLPRSAGKGRKEGPLEGWEIGEKMQIGVAQTRTWTISNGVKDRGDEA